MKNWQASRLRTKPNRTILNQSVIYHADDVSLYSNESDGLIPGLKRVSKGKEKKIDVLENHDFESME